MRLEDAIHKTRVEALVALVTDPQFLRLLIVDLMTLAIAQQDWEDAEISVARRAIDALCLPRAVVTTIQQAFGLLLRANSAISSTADPHGGTPHGSDKITNDG